MASLEPLQQMLPEPIKSLPTFMDYKGQELAERIFKVIITISGVIGLVWGYTEQKFSYTVYCTLAGFFLSCLIIVPPWPAFRIRKDLTWQKVLPTENKDDSVDKHSKDDSKQGKKKK